MNIEKAISQIRKRVKSSGLGAVFTLEEIIRWLELPNGINTIWALEQLEDDLIISHSISFELQQDERRYKIVKADATDRAAAIERAISISVEQ